MNYDQKHNYGIHNQAEYQNAVYAAPETIVPAIRSQAEYMQGRSFEIRARLRELLDRLRTPAPAAAGGGSDNAETRPSLDLVLKRAVSAQDDCCELLKEIEGLL